MRQAKPNQTKPNHPMTTDDQITRDNFKRINSDVNGNPRYYLPVYMTTEEKARQAGGVKYRGKQYGPGWVFQSYAIDCEVEALNS
jgi:hypothetical protein